MADTLDMFSGTLNELANGPRLGGGAAITKALMERLAEKGLPLAHLADPRMMRRSVRTLEANARKFGLAFPDYVPMALRKRLVFMQRGDFFYLLGEHVDTVAALLDLVATGKGDERTVAIPAHALDECRQVLETNWYVVKLVRQKKPKAAKNG